MRPALYSLLPALVLICTATPAYCQDAKPLVITGELTAKDPFDKVRTKSHSKVHELELKAGEGYIIDLRSKEFDTYLRVEDPAGKTVDENDDVSATDRNSRVAIDAKLTGQYRALVTTFGPGKTGKYALEVRSASREFVQEE